MLSRTLQSSNLPHMLFYGPPGTGKTSTILALAKQLYGPELMASRVLELNASDERGIAIVRAKVKDFARMQLSTAPAGAAYRARHPCPPFKIVVLDEADSMTQDAQAALRRTMETYSRMTRFCLVCNYVTRIIDPLASRCSKLRFKSLAPAAAERRVADIAALERVALAPAAAAALVRVADGDLRKAITFLQSAARLAGARNDDDDGDDADAMDVDDASAPAVSVQSVQEIAGVVPDATLARLLDAVFSRTSAGAAAGAKAKKPTRYDAIALVVEDLVAEGWSAAQMVAQLYEAIMYDARVADTHKVKIAAVFSDTDKRLVDGADEHLALLDLSLKTAGIVGGA